MMQRSAAGPLPFAVAVVLFIAFGLPAIALRDLHLVTFFHDDAFYYFEIARNVARGEGFTFDGIHPTNGFHPLWLFVTVPVFAMIDDPMIPLRVIGLLQAAIVAATGAIIFIMLRPRIGRAPAAVAPLALAALPGARQILWSGMESSLLVLLTVAVWSRWLSLPRDAAARRWLGPGVLCALALAARLEGVLLVPALVLLGRRRLIAAPGGLIRLCVPPALMLAGLMAFNRIGFDTWLPVSGMVKAQWAADADVSLGHIALTFPWSVREMACRAFGARDIQLCPPEGRALFISIEIILVGLAVVFRHGLARIVSVSGAAFPFLACVLITLADLWVIRYPQPWYRGPVLLVTALMASLVVAHLKRTAALLAIALALLATGRAIVHARAPRDPATQYATYRVEAAQWLKSNTAHDVRVGSWSAGMLGYFSERSVVNLDGLVNDIDYFRRVTLRHDLAGYLRDERITMLADQGCGPSPSPLPYLNRTGSQHLEGHLHTVAAFYNVTSLDQCPGYAIWGFAADAPAPDQSGSLSSAP